MVEAMSIVNERYVPSVGRLWVESSTTLVPVSLAIAGVADLVGQGCQFTAEASAWEVIDGMSAPTN